MAIEEEQYNRERNIDQRYVMSNPYVGNTQQPNYQYAPTTSQMQGPMGGSYTIAPKYMKSKSECVEELNKILEEIDRKDSNMRRMVDGHNAASLKKFSDDYDNLSQQILRQVETQLR